MRSGDLQPAAARRCRIGPGCGTRDDHAKFEPLRSGCAPVSSRQNARVKELRRLFHEAAPNENGEIAIEGMHLVEEAIRSGLRVPVVLFSRSRQRIGRTSCCRNSASYRNAARSRRGVCGRRAQRNAAGGRGAGTDSQDETRGCTAGSAVAAGDRGRAAGSG